MRSMALAFALVTLGLPARAQDAAPLLLRLAVSPEGPVWVGQRVTVTLTAMTPVRFVVSPSWPDLTASRGRIIVLPEATTVPGTERVNGESYAALQHSYSAFAAEAGELVLAPIRMSARVSGNQGQPVDAEVATDETRIATRLPPGISDMTRLVVAPSFRMTATTEGEMRQIHVGEAVVRTLRMEADDTTAMLLPAAEWGQPEGVRVYPDPPVLHDHSDRGVFHALRTERVAFVPERPGPVELPGFSVSWFDPGSGRPREVKVDPLHLDVLPAAGTDAGPVTKRTPWPWVIGVGALVMLGAVLLWLVRRRRRPHATPPIDALAAACRAGDARTALRALYRWCDALVPPGGDRTIEALAFRAGVPALASETAALEVQVFGAAEGMPRWSGAALLDAAHKTERSLRRKTPHGQAGALPALNPFSGARAAPRVAQPRWAR